MNRSKGNIDEFLQKHSMSQNELARHLETTSTTIARWRKSSHPNPMQLQLILSQLEIRLEAAKMLKEAKPCQNRK